MPRSRSPYSPEFRQQMIELVRNGRTPWDTAQKFVLSAQTILNWVAQADCDAGVRHDGPTSTEQEELRRSRHANKRLREEL